MDDKFYYDKKQKRSDIYTPTVLSTIMFDMPFDTTGPEKFASSIRLGIEPCLSGTPDDLLCYLEEAIEVIRVGKYRSAIIQLFAMGVERVWQRVWQKVDNDESKWCNWIDALNPPKEFQKYGFSLKYIKKPELPFNEQDWHLYYTENQILVFGNLLGFYDANALHSLYNDCFKLRCKAAHPSGTKISAEQVAIMIRHSVTYLW